MKRESEILCLECALCCNGALFGDVKLRASDHANLLARANVPLVPVRASRQAPHGTEAVSTALKLLQPCAALCGTRCRVYELRPAHCREFECALLKKLQRGEVTFPQALKKIRSARRKLAAIEKLFARLGDTHPHLPLKKRLANLARKLETRSSNAGIASEKSLPRQQAALFSRLSLAVHELHLLLATVFYPGSE